MDIEEYKASMPKCKDCTGFGWGECKTAGENEAACKDFERKPKLTNADRIRQMTDEELATEIRSSICEKVGDCENDLDCYKCRLQWLKQEVSEDAGTD